MVNSRTEATLAVVGLEKAIAKMENFMLEFRASRASPLMTFQEFRSPGSAEAHQQYIRQHTRDSTGVTSDKSAPSIGPNQLLHLPTFNGTDALGWLARADQYFRTTKTPPTSQVDIALLAIDRPAVVWKQLLVHRCPSLSWDRFVHELMKRFGDSDAWEPKFVAVRQEIPAINTSTKQPDPPTNPEPHTSDAVVASSPFLRSNTATPDLPQTLADHGSSIDATHITAAPALPAQQPIAPSRFAASSPAAQYKHFQKLPVTPPAVALTTLPVFQIVAQFQGYGFTIHFRLHMGLSAVPLDTLMLCTLPPIYKHEFEPPPVTAIS